MHHRQRTGGPYQSELRTALQCIPKQYVEFWKHMVALAGLFLKVAELAHVSATTESNFMSHYT